jgi:hypothetical protein
MAGKYQELTAVHAVVTVETEEGRGGLATCAQARRRHPEADTGASPHHRRAPWPERCEHLLKGGQEEFTDTSNQTTTSPTGITPNLSGTTALLTGDEQNAKLAVGNAWPGLGKMGHRADFLCHLLA